MTGTDSALQDHGLGFFELLAREAPVTRYDELVHQASRDGVGQATLDRLMIAKRLALEVRDLFGRRHRRGAELAVLVDTARDLARSPGLQAALRLIVGRARLLLAMDVAFVSLLDEVNGDSCVASAVGAATALTPGFRIPGGGGLVVPVDAREPVCWSADYLADERVAHDSVTDGMVRAEGLHAVLSVPLRFDGRYIGDLHVGHRDVHFFTPDEVALLRSLADLAANAVDRGTLLDDARTELEEARQDASRARAELNAARKAGELRADLSQLVLDGDGLHELLVRSVREVGGALHVRDRAGGRLAAVGGLPPPDEGELGRAHVQALAAGRPLRLSTGSWVMPLAARSDDLGWLLYHPGETFDSTHLEMLPAIAQSVATLLMTRSTTPSQGRVDDGLLDDLITPPPVSERDRVRARLPPVELDCPHVVVVARPEGAEQPRVEWAISVAHSLGGMKAVRDGQAVLLLPGDDPGAGAREVSRQLSALLGRPVTAGGAGPAHTAEAVGRTYQEAVRCVDALVALDGKGQAACSQDLGFLGMLLADSHDVPGFIESVVGPVLSYDARRRTSLVATLETYFDSAGSRIRAAQVLHVHPNTVSRRLDRITQLLDREWQRPDQALEVQLALRLQRVRESLRPGRGGHRPGTQL
ncbi:helix-turn-helix domain-containing protein [Streptomyces sp. ACA25]|nr:helix-turn-helix domain-containing protein [Streptomyces sp. ACA25]MDB1090304.1 helix-turn-helix domain-containing protein [Streptomyces sp. ACA25]